MTANARENFIPVNKSELAAHLQKKFSTKDERKQFGQFCSLVSSIFHYQYHSSLESLKSLYSIFDPDTDKFMLPE